MILNECTPLASAAAYRGAPQFAQLVQTCLEKDPRNRFSDFKQIRDRLTSIYHEVAGVPFPGSREGIGAERGSME